DSIISCAISSLSRRVNQEDRSVFPPRLCLILNSLKSFVFVFCFVSIILFLKARQRSKKKKIKNFENLLIKSGQFDECVELDVVIECLVFVTGATFSVFFSAKVFAKILFRENKLLTATVHNDWCEKKIWPGDSCMPRGHSH
ncbi:hypothetical protein RFI_32764, partial [Reticulomyxa filosa]